MSCKVINPANGKESELHKELLNILGDETLSQRAYAKVSGPSFVEDFGDWITNTKEGFIDESVTTRSSENGEPRLLRKKGTNQYYFLDKNNEKYFLDKYKFSGMEEEDVAEVTRVLVYDFVTNGNKKSLNEFDENELKEGQILASIERSIKLYKEDVSQIGDEDVESMLNERADLVLKHKHDFRREVISSIEALGKTFREKVLDDEGNPVTEIQEADRSTNLNIKESFASNSKDSATVNTKIFLSQINDVIDGDINPGKYLSKQKFVEFNEVWSTIQPMLSDIVGYGHGQNVVDVFALMKNELIKHESIKPWISDLLDQLEEMERTNKDKVTEFVQAMSNTKLNFYVTEVNGNKYKVLNATSTGSRESQILNEWGHVFNTENVKGGLLSASGREKVEAISERLDAVFADYNQNIKLAGKETESTPLEEKEAIEERQNNAISEAAYEVIYALNELGAFSVLPEDIRTFILMNGGIENKLREINRLFESTRYTLDSVLSKGKRFIIEGEFVNPFLEESGIKHLAAAIGMRSTDISESSILSNKGKTYFAFTNPSYLSNKVNEWVQELNNKADDDLTPTSLERLAMLDYNANSVWLSYLLGVEKDENGEIIIDTKKSRELAKDRLSKLKIGLSSSFKSKGKNDGVGNTEVKFPDAINESITKMLGSKIKGGKSYFPTITPADKSRKIEFEGLPMFNSGIDIINGKKYIHPDTIELFINYFTDEYNRMKVVARENRDLDDKDKVVHYHGENGNGRKSQLFHEFSYDGTNEKYAAIRAALYDSDGNPLSDDSSLGLDSNQIALLEEGIRSTLEDRLDQTLEEFTDIDNMDSRLLQAYKESHSSATAAIAGDYLVNGIIAAAEYMKMFSGDPAYYKNSNDLIKRIPSTYTDGLQLRLRTNDELTFNQATIDGVEVASRYVDLIKSSVKDQSIIDDYNRVNTTDAQAWITPRRWKFLKQRLGQWSPKHDKVYDRMMDGKTLTPSEMKIAAQPLKGVYFEINDGRPVYLKYSQAVLIPSMVKGLPIERLYNKMTQDPDTGKPWSNKDGHKEIHEVITIDGVKVGSKGTTKIHDGNDILPEFELNSTKLTNRGWKLQQDLPIKTMHETNVGSQIQKTILSGLALEDEYSEGRTGADILQDIHDIVGKLSNMGKYKLTERFGIVGNKITDKESIYKALIEEFKSRGGNDNVISALEKETALDAIPQIKGKVQSIFMSIINKEITKIATNGGAYIQVSPFGLESISSKEYYKTDRDLDTSYLLKIKNDIDLSTKESSFKESKVERQVFHISKNKIDKFNSSKLGSNTGAPDTGLGIFFSDDYSTIASMREIKNDLLEGKESLGNNIHKVSINLKNPYIHNGFIDSIVENGTKEEYNNKRKELEELGHDGIVYGLGYDGESQDYGFVVFDEKNTRIEDVVNDSKSLDKNRPSDFGKRTIKTIENNSGIKIVSKNYDGKGLKPPRIEDGVVKPGQVFLPHTDAIKLLSENGIDYVGKTSEELMELLTPDVLKIVSYRIPNQGMSSNDLMEIVGILPPSMGDSIIAYDGIPAKTGSDFDIDKMFIMTYNLVYNPENSRVERLDESNKQFAQGDVDKLLTQNELVELYSEVLESPRTYDAMMRSIDGAFLKDDIAGNKKKGIKGLFPAPEMSNLEMFSPTQQIKTKFEYLSGKFGVAQTANQLVDHVLNQSLQIELGSYLGIGNSVVKPNGDMVTIFDKDSPKNTISTRYVTERKNVLNITPIKSADKKAIAKSKISNKFIGYSDGIEGSSTAHYSDQAGALANTGSYSGKDVVFVSVPGRRGDLSVRKSQQDRTIRESIKALNSGATIILDNKSYINSSSYNEGESRMMKNLENMGFNYTEVTVDGVVLGAWKKNTGQSIAEVLSAFLNAYVDIAKDPYISRGNHNAITAGTTFMLIRAGVDFAWVNRFIGHPILQELVKLTNSSQGITSEDLKIKGERATPVEYLRNKYSLTEEKFDPDRASGITMKKLEDSYDLSDNEFNSEILAAFEYYQGIAKKFNEAMSASKSDTKGAGGSFVSRQIAENKYNKAIEDDVIKNFDSKFKDTMLGTYKDNAIDWFGEVLDNSNLFLTAGRLAEETFDKISEVTGKGQTLINEDLGRKIEASYYSYLMSGTDMMSKNNDNHLDLFVELPNRLKEIKKTSNNFLIQELSINESQGYSFIGMSSKNKPTYYENKIYREWMNLYLDEDTKDLAVDLAKYAYSQSGFQNNSNQFFTMIPHEILKENNLANDVRDMAKESSKSVFDGRLVDQFLRHNWDDTSVVSTVNDSATVKIGNLPKNIGFIYDPTLDTKKGLSIDLVSPTGKRITEYPMFITRRVGESKILYKKSGYKLAEDGNKPVYEVSSKLGLTTNKGKIFEYLKDVDLDQSVVAENRLSPEVVGMRSKMREAMLRSELFSDKNQKITAAEVVQDEFEELNTTPDNQNPSGENEFSYAGKTISTDFTLGAEQKQALTDILDFVTGKKKPSKNKNGFMLQGSAGTGKTTIIGYVEKMLREISPSYGMIYMAPTHAATVQLAQTTVKTGNRILPATLASSVGKDKNGKYQFTYKTRQLLEIYPRPVIVVDESSMVGDKEFEGTMKSAEKSGVKVVFMGDIAQIPEVKPGAKSKRVSPAFEKLDRSVLNKVYRQSAGSLLNLLTKVRNNNKYITYKTKGDDSIQFLDRADRIDSLEADVIHNPDDTIMISYSNSAVGKANAYARKLQGISGPPKVGEQVIGYGGYNNKSISRADVANSVKYKITEIEIINGVATIITESKTLENLVRLGVRGVEKKASSIYYQLSRNDSFDFEISEAEMESNNKEVSRDMKKISDINIQLKSTPRNMMRPLLERKKLIQMQLSQFDLGGDYIYNPSTDRMEKFNFNQHGKIDKDLKLDKGIDFGYAITIHKSQGLTIPNVYFDVASINVSPNEIEVFDGDKVVTTEKNALYYVGMSRASEKLVLPADYNYDEVLEDKPVEVERKSLTSQDSSDATQDIDAPTTVLSLDFIKANLERIKRENNIKKDCE